jgi:tetratricopeptide (TPR) repeat protein
VTAMLRVVTPPRIKREKTTAENHPQGFNRAGIWLVGTVAAVVVSGALLLRKPSPPQASALQVSNAFPTEVGSTSAVGVAAEVQPQEGGTEKRSFDELPDDEKAGLLSSRGEELLAAKDYRGAVAAFRESIRLDPKVETVHYNLGIAHARADESKEAIAAYKKALELAPDYGEAHNNLGNVLVKIGRIDEAITHFKDAIRINPDDPVNYNNLGTALARRGRVAEAADQFAKAVNLSPKYLEARYNLANTYLEEGNFEESAREFRAILDLNPQYGPARQGLARLAAKLQKVSTP